MVSQRAGLPEQVPMDTVRSLATGFHARSKFWSEQLIGFGVSTRAWYLEAG